MNQHIHKPSGSSLIIVIVFSAIVIMSIGAIISLIISQQRSIGYAIASERAFQIAEAGINRYRWFLAHDPEDFSGLDADYFDPVQGLIGHYTVEVTPPDPGSSIVTMTSTGWTYAYPNQKRILRTLYGQPSYAEFAFLTNSNVWFGPTESVHGRLHSNGGIRMDGIVDSIATSIKETYICGPEHDCADEEKPGIWGTGQDPQLWDFPVTDGVDFDVITLDLETMQTEADASSTLLAPSTGFGYHIIFQSDGTFDVNTVTALRSPVWGHDGTNWTYESNSIQTETPLTGFQNVPIPVSGIIFSEDQTWVSGQVNGRVTVAAASIPEGSGPNRDIIIHDDITYYPDRTSGSALGLIAQQDILVPLYSPDNLTIDAALMAQNGHVFRYYYYPAYYPADTIKSYMETYGTIITNTVWTWSWVNSSSQIVSGYQITNTNYDPNLYYTPPPFFPTKDEYVFISWEEVLPNE